MSHYFFAKLPERIQKLAKLAFHQFLTDPDHPALRRHELKDTKKGRHRKGTFSVSITKQYRALYVVDDDTNVWYWVGNHNDYENYSGKK